MLEQLGFAPDGAITPLDALPNPTPELMRAYHVAAAQLTGLPAQQRPARRRALVERAAYSSINRLLALRTLETRGLFPETLHPNPAYDGLAEALFILRHMEPAGAPAGAQAGCWASRPTSTRQWKP